MWNAPFGFYITQIFLRMQFLRSIWSKMGSNDTHLVFWVVTLKCRYKSTQCYNPEYQQRHLHPCENLKATSGNMLSMQHLHLFLGFTTDWWVSFDL
jgi:hypothetical protein